MALEDISGACGTGLSLHVSFRKNGGKIVQARLPCGHRVTLTAAYTNISASCTTTHTRWPWQHDQRNRATAWRTEGGLVDQPLEARKAAAQTGRMSLHGTIFHLSCGTSRYSAWWRQWQHRHRAAADTRRRTGMVSRQRSLDRPSASGGRTDGSTPRNLALASAAPGTTRCQSDKIRSRAEPRVRICLLRMSSGERGAVMSSAGSGNHGIVAVIP